VGVKTFGVSAIDYNIKGFPEKRETPEN